MIIENQRIYLRKLKTSDANFMYELMNQSNWKKYIGDRNINSIKSASDYLKKGPINDYALYGFGLFIVIDKMANLPVGVCGLLKRPYLHAPDLGFAISEQHVKQGYAYEASILCIEYFKQHAFAKHLLASTKESNKASRALLEKLGFKEKGMLTIDLEKYPSLSNDGLLLYQKDF